MRYARCLLLVAVSVTLVGCGSDGPARAVVQGQVSFRGRPVEDGFIRFIPTGTTEGPAAAAQIRDGAYLVEGRGGVVAGVNRVEIYGFRPKAGASVDVDGLLVREDFLPAKYNRKSQLEVTIVAGDTPNIHDFDLD